MTDKYTIHGEILEIDESGEYNDIPERCPECNCVQEENFQEFSENLVQVCLQCKHEMRLRYV